MKARLRKSVSFLLALYVISQITAPVGAQTTILKGSVATARQRLVRQEARYDTAPPSDRGLSAAATTSAAATPAAAAPRTYAAPRDERTFFQRHPKVRAAAIGAGVGTAAGAVTGLVSGRGVIRGAAIGAGTGAGVGLIRSSKTMKRHPIVRDVATGAAVGLGLGWAASRKGKNIGAATGVGAAVGLGVGLFKDKLR